MTSDFNFIWLITYKTTKTPKEEMLVEFVKIVIQIKRVQRKMSKALGNYQVLNQKFLILKQQSQTITHQNLIWE